MTEKDLGYLGWKPFFDSLDTGVASPQNHFTHNPGKITWSTQKISNGEPLDCEQSLFRHILWGWGGGGVGECKRTRTSRALSHESGRLRVSLVLLDGPRKKRDCS